MGRRRVRVRKYQDKRRKHPEGLGYWNLRWLVDGDPVYETLGFLPEEDAEHARAMREAALLLGVVSPTESERLPTSLKVAEVLATYGETVLFRGQPTWQNLEEGRLVRLSMKLGRYGADLVGLRHLQQVQADWVAEGLKRNTIRNLWKTWGRAWRHARDTGLVQHIVQVPHAKSLPDDSRPPRRLTEAEVRAMVAHAGEDAPLVQFMAWSGWRPAAVSGLLVQHTTKLVDPELRRHERMAFVPEDKGGVNRGWRPLAEPALEAMVSRLEQLGAFRSPGQRVFTSPRGGKLHLMALGRIVKAAAERAGVADVQPYDLRRFAAVRICKALAWDLETACRFTGHRDAKTLLRYTYSEKGEAEAAATGIGWTPQALKLVQDSDDS